MLINRIALEQAERQSWELDRALLGHTPGTTESASELRRTVKEIRKRIQYKQLLATGSITEQDIQRAEDAEDGVMRQVE